MSEPALIPDPDEQLLARLAACDLAAAEKVHGKLMAAEEASEIAELGRTYQRLARSLRQTLALKAKLKRDRELATREPAPKPGGGAVATRLRQVRQAVTRVIWDEAETAEAADFTEDLLEGLLAEEALSDAFGAEPLDDHVARACAELGLSADRARRWRDLPDPGEAQPSAGPDEPPDRASSA